MIVELKITGMHCDGCAKSVENALRSVFGVESAQVDLEQGKAEAKGSGFASQDLVAAVEAAGFDVVTAA